MSKRVKIGLGDHFSYGKLFRFTLGPVCMMIFTSAYSIVDGYFVSNYVGSTAFASLNLTMPFLLMFAAIGFMFGTGGCALVSMYLGMGEKEKANSSFSLIIYFMVFVGALLSVFGYIFSPQIAVILGADEAMLPYCVTYIKINMVGNVLFMLQTTFQSFLIAAERPNLGFAVTVIAGLTNMFLDWLLVGVLELGIAGAAMATVIGQLVGGGIPLVFFLAPNSSRLRLGRTHFESFVIVRTCGNGLSEFLSNMSGSVVGFFYNLQLLKYLGEDGVSAYGVIMYVSFIFTAVYFGYSMGTSPIIAYEYGADDHVELHNMFKKSMIVIASLNVLLTVIAEAFVGPLSRLFVGYAPRLLAITENAMKIYSMAFLLMGFNIFASSFFTALNNGIVSAIISTSRTLVLQLLMIFLLPTLFGVDGLWYVVLGVEGCGILISGAFLIRNKKKYKY